MQETQETVGSIPGLRRFPGVGNGNPFQYSCLENSMDRGTWCAKVHGVTKSRTLLSTMTRKNVQKGEVGVMENRYLKKNETHLSQISCMSGSVLSQFKI